MSIIAGRPGGSLNINGHVLHYCIEHEKEGTPFHCAPVLSDRVAWLQQHDAFFERLTVKETLDLAVFLEWPLLPFAQRNELSIGCLESLGLVRVRDRQVGSPKKARTSDGATLSGGEMRRLSVALELVVSQHTCIDGLLAPVLAGRHFLILLNCFNSALMGKTNPHVFLADEATSGVDSKISETVMSAISSLVKERQIPCFCTLHQPRSSIWHMLDYFILMSAGGKIVYVGTREASIEYFASLGYSCPKLTNPAEYFVDLVSVDTEDAIQAAKDRDRIEQLALVFQERNTETSNSLKAVRVAAPLESMQPRKALLGTRAANPFRILRRFGALLRRSWRQTIRSRGLNGFRLVASIGTALLLAQIFPSITKGPPSSRSVTDRICLLSFGSINMFLIAIMKTIGIFSKEKPVVHRERSRNDYTNFEYILSKAFVETPMDMLFAICFTSTLKLVTGLAIGWKQLSGVFALMTLSGASLGFLLGSMAKSEEAATAAAMPIVVILMIVGIINPSGVDPTAASPAFVTLFKYFSPIASAIEALVVAEFSGMKFGTSSSKFGFQNLRDLPRMGGLALVQNGDAALDALGLGAVKFDTVLQHTAVLSLLNFGLSWMCLSVSNIRLQRWKSNARSFLLGKRKRNRVPNKRRTASSNNRPTQKEAQQPATKTSIPSLKTNGRLR